LSRTNSDNFANHGMSQYGHLPHLSPKRTEVASIERNIVSYKAEVTAK